LEQLVVDHHPDPARGRLQQWLWLLKKLACLSK